MRALAFLFAGLLLSGCGTVGGWFGKSDAQGKPPAISAAFKPLQIWRGSTGAAESSVFVPAVENGSVYIASENGEISRYKGLTGALVWKIDTKHALSAGVGFGDDLVFVGTGKGEILAYDREGKFLWNSQLSGEILSPPQASDGIVVARTADGRIFGLDAKDGKRKWIYQRPTPLLTVRSFAGVTITQGAVFAGFPGGKLVAISLQDGKVGWEATVSQPKGATELERVTDVTSLPVIDELQVCAAAFQGRLACFDIGKGDLIWARDISSDAGLTVSKRQIFITDEKGAVLALDSSAGSSMWKQEGLVKRKPTAPYVQDNYVVVGDIQGYVYFLDRENGEIVAMAETDGSPIVGQPVLLDEDVFLVQTQKGGLYALAAP